MIRIFFWPPTESNVGHSSMQIKTSDQNCVYISWWPAGPLNDLKKSSGTSQSLQDDEECEGKPAETSVELETGLDEQAICQWWEEFQNKNFEYDLGGKNCSWVVIQALRAGGSDRFFPWYKVGIKRNIPVKSVVLPIVIPLLEYAVTRNLLVAAPMVVDILKRYANAARTLKPRASFKLAAVAVIDEFSSVWSPQDALLYCSFLGANLRIAKTGEALLGA